jgi:hypothetical protein
VFNGVRNISDKEIKKYKNVKQDKRTSEVRIDKIINEMLEAIIELKRDAHGDFQTLSDLIEVSIRQNIKHEKQIDEIYKILGKKNFTNEDRKNLKKNIQKSKKKNKTVNLEQMRLLRFIKRQYDDAASDTSFD